MRNIKIVLLATTAAVLFTATSCKKDENGYRVTYYKTIGEGHVWDVTNNRPIKGATITVTSIYDDPPGLFSTPKTENTFTTDENGYYQFRFIKKVYGGPGLYKVTRYWFNWSLSPMLPPPSSLLPLGKI